MSELETWTAPSESVMWTVTVPLFPLDSVNVQVNAEPFLILTSSGQVTDLTAGGMFFRRNFSAFFASIVSEPPIETEHAESVIPRSSSETAMPARRTRQILGEAQDGPGPFDPCSACQLEGDRQRAPALCDERCDSTRGDPRVNGVDRVVPPEAERQKPFDLGSLDSDHLVAA